MKLYQQYWFSFLTWNSGRKGRKYFSPKPTSSNYSPSFFLLETVKAGENFWVKLKWKNIFKNRVFHTSQLTLKSWNSGRKSREYFLPKLTNRNGSPSCKLQETEKAGENFSSKIKMKKQFHKSNFSF